ncbi:MAG: hypothetical protein KC613_02115 [Myxococcales bacterium]|nr:hypothetical protein [Myxococcales bacterium]
MGLKTWIATGLGVGVVLAVVFTHRTIDRLEADTACTSCHAEVHVNAKGAVPTHPEVACQTCHTTSLGVAWKLSRADDIPRKQQKLGENVVQHGAVADATCEGCHTGQDTTTKAVADTVGHAAHFKGAEPVPCQRCHAGSVHDGRPPAETCSDKGCHDDQKMARSPMAEQHCLTCHQFLDPPVTAAKAGAHNGRWTQCASCHGPNSVKALPVSLHAQMPCDVCHKPHEEPFTVARGCEDCHDKVVHAHPEVENTVYCTACHGPHDEWAIAPQRCAGCHEDQVLEGVPAELAGQAAIDPDVLLVAQAEQAAHATCVECHKSHERDGEMGSKRCGDCHDDVQHPLQHQQSTCDDCHAPHRPQPRTCEGCHAKDVRVRHGRAECVECHAVHDEPLVQRDCRACHADTPRDGGHPKSQCGDCHQPHAPQPKGCDACHKDQVKAVRGLKPEHTDCAKCHKAHDWTFDVQGCKDCHEDQAKATQPIKDHAKCESCHASHSMKVSGTSACRDCHKDDLRRTPKDHLECAKCHDQHSGSRAGKQECKDCHKERFQFPKGTPKHKECDDCHEMHPKAGWAEPTCESCHDGGKAAQPVGLHTDDGHQKCGDCHKAHAPVKTDRKACLSCHEDQLKHEPDAPLCNGCHVFKAAAPK